MTNQQIIHETIQFLGSDFPYDGTNLKTYNEWQKVGFQVERGQKAFIMVKLWKQVDKKKQDINGNISKEKGFIAKNTALFTISQCKEIKELQTA